LLVCGLDIGSTTAKAVLVQDSQVLAAAIKPTGIDIPQVAEEIVAEVLSQGNFKRQDISQFIATGYGRISVPFATRQVTEITCCARGIHHCYPAARTVIDIGGQDTKVILLDDGGRVVNFAMNDRCAAGTGRFLEVASQTLKVDVADLGKISAKSKNRAEISSMCTVFAQAEIVSMIMQKTPIEDIIAGLHYAIASRVFGLVSSIGPKLEYAMVGGVAKNLGVVRAMEEKLGHKIHVPEEPQLIVATGAALM
jgi:predicted CoA-substrate-specific enzyme activase